MAKETGASRSLSHKRILITDIENEFGKELKTSLKGEGAVIFTLVRECPQMQQVIKDNPDVIPVLLDINAKDGVDEGSKLLKSFPTLDHIVNLSGDIALDVISKAYVNWKIQDFGENKAKPLVSKMKDAGNRGLIFHSSAGNQNLMSKLKANLNPRYTDSATAQVSTSVRKSIKRLFSKESSAPLYKPTPTPTSSNLSQSIEESKIGAANFHSIATSLSQSSSSSGGKSSPTGSNEQTSTEVDSKKASPKRSLSLKLKLRDGGDNPKSGGGGAPGATKILSMAEKNEKIRESVTKINNKACKKYTKLIKNMEKEQSRQLKRLDKDVNLMKKKEKAALMRENAQANADTAARSNVLSADTANRIMASREARVDREIGRKADKKRDEDTQKIAEDKNARIQASTDKLYHKTVAKQIAEFNRIKTKYLVG